ncbi:MAG: 50S ribosomal protein L24 [Spirochaetota bacterium]|nr:50S ribosomal protein L24 [Spirochaetota bacterium]
MNKTRLKKNDNVVVITGSECGSRGKILYVNRSLGKVIVEGINKKKKFIRASQENPKGGIISLESPVHISNIMYFCDKCKVGVRIGVKETDSKKIRICKKCRKSID